MGNKPIREIREIRVRKNLSPEFIQKPVPLIHFKNLSP